MNCNIFKDLIPLYLDGCCSQDSTSAVQDHISQCESCKKLTQTMSAELEFSPAPVSSKSLKPINQWKASVLQSVLLFISFAIITVGVALEARIPAGLLNGYFAFNLVVPATGFLLSMANWYFMPIYKTKKAFSNSCLLATIALSFCCTIWSLFHYEINILELFTGHSLLEIIDVLIAMLGLDSIGLFLTLIFCTSSIVLSERYATLLGKE